MSIRTDKVYEAECNLPEDCKADGSIVTEQNCNDPAYAAAHPEECDNHPQDFPKLILKPGAVCVSLLGTVGFRAFVYNNGVEMEVFQGLTFRSSNPAVALIGASGGMATGLSGGIVEISVEWQDLTAHSQLTVVDDATQTVMVGTAVMVDNSQSMNLAFGLAFSTRLAYAKQAAYRYVTELNATKDVTALYRFNTAAFPIFPLTNSIATLQPLVNAIPSSLEKTNIADSISDAAIYLNAQGVDRRVILLISDGENKEGPDPVLIAQAFRDSGGVIVVLGVRASGDGFKLLEKLATNGFFLNATLLNSATVLDELSGLKGYLCAGNCAPEGDLIVPHAQLNYTGWVNWDTSNTTGPVDLIGGTPPYALYDLLPGNGLYADLAGSSPPWLGKMTLKESVLPTIVDTSELSFYLAGNQREDVDGYQVRVLLYAADINNPLIDQTITIDDWKQPFTLYAYEFEPDDIVANGGVFTLSFEMLTGGVAPFYGPLLDRIKIRRTSDDTILFYDDFDDENPTFIPPACGQSETEGYTYTYGYAGCYGTGCLTTPPGETLQDTDPPPDIE